MRWQPRSVQHGLPRARGLPLSLLRRCSCARDEVAVPEPCLCGSPVMIAIDASPPTNPPCTPTKTTTWRSTPRFSTHESTMHAHHDHHLAVDTALPHPRIHHARPPRPPLGGQHRASPPTNPPCTPCTTTTTPHHTPRDGQSNTKPIKAVKTARTSCTCLKSCRCLIPSLSTSMAMSISSNGVSALV